MSCPPEARWLQPRSRGGGETGQGCFSGLCRPRSPERGPAPAGYLPGSRDLRPPPGLPGPRSAAASPAARPRAPALSSSATLANPGPAWSCPAPKGVRLSAGSGSGSWGWAVRDGGSGFSRERRRADGEIREPSLGLCAAGGVWRPRAAAAAAGEAALGAVAQAARVGLTALKSLPRPLPWPGPAPCPVRAVGAREGQPVSGGVKASPV